MPYSLAELAKDIHGALTTDAGPDGKVAICKAVSKALLDKEFIAENLPDRRPGETPRKVLYEDPDLGFCICGHVHSAPAKAPAHDHGPSWAIYGQAEGETHMAEWKIVERGDPILVEKVDSYIMKPGDARFYDIGGVHSVDRLHPVRLIRIEGSNLDRVQRSNIKEKAA